MNRLFDMLIWGVSALLAAFFVLLLGGMVSELFRHSLVRPPETGEILFAARLSLLTATAASVIALLVSVPVAYLLSRKTFPLKDLFDTLLDLPIVLSPIALGALLLVFFNTPAGRVLDRTLGPFVFEVRGIILAQFVVVVGLSIRLLKNTFENIDEDYENLARTLGCDSMAAFLRVTLPMASRGMAAAFLLVWGRAVGEFGATVTLAGATTMKTETMPVAIYINFESADISSAMVFIALLVMSSLAVLFLLRKVHVIIG
jgi:molybdate transport system permease protein